MPDYQKGKIYRLVCGDLEYIGSTIEQLCKRKAGHKTHYKLWKKGKIKGWCSSYKLFDLDENGVDIVLLEEYPCENKAQLHARKRYWIENRECVNICIPTRTEKEYYEANREKILQQKKEYFEANKEKIKQQKKEYYEKNREKIKQKYKSNIN